MPIISRRIWLAISATYAASPVKATLPGENPWAASAARVNATRGAAVARVLARIFGATRRMGFGGARGALVVPVTGVVTTQSASPSGS